MIVIEKAKLKFLMAGRQLHVEDANATARYRKGRTYALGIVHNRTLCRVLVERIAEQNVYFRLAEADKATMLAQRSEYGYTDDPSKAMFAEPEAVDPRDIERINRRHRERMEAFSDQIVRDAERLAQDANRLEGRRLRNLTRVALSLAGTAAA